MCRGGTEQCAAALVGEEGKLPAVAAAEAAAGDAAAELVEEDEEVGDRRGWTSVGTLRFSRLAPPACREVPPAVSKPGGACATSVECPPRSMLACTTESEPRASLVMRVGPTSEVSPVRIFFDIQVRRPRRSGGEPRRLLSLFYFIFYGGTVLRAWLLFTFLPNLTSCVQKHNPGPKTHKSTDSREGRDGNDSQKPALGTRKAGRRMR